MRIVQQCLHRWRRWRRGRSPWLLRWRTMSYTHPSSKPYSPSSSKPIKCLLMSHSRSMHPHPPQIPIGIMRWSSPQIRQARRKPLWRRRLNLLLLLLLLSLAPKRRRLRSKRYLKHPSTAPAPSTPHSRIPIQLWQTPPPHQGLVYLLLLLLLVHPRPQRRHPLLHRKWRIIHPIRIHWRTQSSLHPPSLPRRPW